jgi:hypothetical protein
MNSFTKTLCVKCLEFYGSQEREGMCSVCYKKNIDESSKQEDKKVEILENNDNSEINKQVNPIEHIEENKKLEQTNKMNCWKCQIRVGYLGFNCNCGYVFCGKHRHFSDHNCDFDYKNYDRQKLQKKLENCNKIK